MVSPLQLAGTTLEGGGQLLRIAVGISALAGIPISIRDIRGNRPGGGGLKNQHLTAVKWLAAASSAETIGAEKKSCNLDFTPAKERNLKAKELPLDIGSPGSPASVGLVFQAILPFIIFSGHSSDTSPISISIKGGTNVSHSPSFEYIDQVLLPTLARIGLPPVTATLQTRGWSTGRVEIGQATFNITPLPHSTHLPAFKLQNRGKITNIRATLLAPESCHTHARASLEKATTAKIPASAITAPNASDLLTVHLAPSNHPKRLYLLLVATSAAGHRLGCDWLFDEKIRDLPTAITRLVYAVVNGLAREIAHGGCVDGWMSDQLVVFQALARGRSAVDVGVNMAPSLHAKTAEWVVRELLGEGVVFDGKGGCEGVGFVAGERFAERMGKRDGVDGEVVNGTGESRVGGE